MAPHKKRVKKYLAVNLVLSAGLMPSSEKMAATTARNAGSWGLAGEAVAVQRAVGAGQGSGTASPVAGTRSASVTGEERKVSNEG